MNRSVIVFGIAIVCAVIGISVAVFHQSNVEPEFPSIPDGYYQTQIVELDPKIDQRTYVTWNGETLRVKSPQQFRTAVFFGQPGQDPTTAAISEDGEVNLGQMKKALEQGQVFFNVTSPKRIIQGSHSVTTDDFWMKITPADVSPGGRIVLEQQSRVVPKGFRTRDGRTVYGFEILKDDQDQ